MLSTITNKKSLYLDCSKLNAIDSSGLALILEMIVICRKRNIYLRIDIPNNTVNLSEIYGIKEILNEYIAGNRK